MRSCTSPPDHQHGADLRETQGHPKLKMLLSLGSLLPRTCPWHSCTTSVIFWYSLTLHFLGDRWALWKNLPGWELALGKGGALSVMIRIERKPVGVVGCQSRFSVIWLVFMEYLLYARNSTSPSVYSFSHGLLHNLLVCILFSRWEKKKVQEVNNFLRILESVRCLTETPLKGREDGGRTPKDQTSGGSIWARTCEWAFTWAWGSVTSREGTGLALENLERAQLMR